MEGRFHKDNKEISPESIDRINTFLLVDSKVWRKPGIISVEKLGNVFQIQIDEDIMKKNVTAVAFSNQDEMPELPPDTLSLIHISEPTRLLSISYAVFCLKKKK